MRNPFTPSFGQVPSKLAGRTDLLTDLTAAFKNGVGDPNLTTILIGARGTGKTALLTYMSSVVGEFGWVSSNVPCGVNMLDDILLQARKAAQNVLDTPQDKKLDLSASVSVAGFGVGLGVKSAEAQERVQNIATWRLEMEDLLDQLEEKGSGLLITVDEVDPKQDEMIQLASMYQMFVRAERPVGLLMAGLPHNVSQLLADKSVSFLRRACQRYLGPIADYEVSDAFKRTIEAAGKSIDDDALEHATKAIGGFPFMLQLVGYRSWNASGDNELVSKQDVVDGAAMARKDLEARVLKITLDELAPAALNFLQVMEQDEEYSKTADIAERLGKSAGYVSNYRRKLLEHGVIEEVGRGKVRFGLPYLREYLPKYLELNC